MLIFPAVLLLAIPARTVGRLDWDAFATYGSFEDLRREQEREMLEERLNSMDQIKLGQRDGFVTVAIDGAAGSGKTSTARALAERCGYASVSTGEHYRALAALFLAEHIPVADEAALEARLRQLQLSTIFCGSRAWIAVNGKTFSESELRSPAVTEAVPAYASRPVLRRFLHDYERQLPAAARAAGFKGIVMEGRDVASAVVPDGDLRVYLEVGLEERAKRRAREGIVDNVAERDRRDRKQMGPAKGVWHLDGTGLSLEEVVALLQSRLQEVDGR
ncbi:MAG: (d)CMP kinase [Puniceicoccales bacterium]|nr:(d)CMP kinase [Puniceicoccales bacterium]